jgi:PBP1b-binding outer membrane lipoprotein LpoB
MNKSIERTNMHSIKAMLGLFLVITLLFAGCEKKDEPQPKVEQSPAGVNETPQAATNTTVDTVKEEPKPEFPDMVGTWTGSLDGRATTLKITKQEGEKFSGTIVVNFREAVHQSVSGKINLEKRVVTMSDVLRARSMGTYYASLSEDGTKLSGTFTQTVDKIKAKFNLSKKK